MAAIQSIEVISDTPESTYLIGQQIGRQLNVGDVLLLNGDLGAGKTTLTQGIAAGLGIHEPVQSPTFTLVVEHDSRTADGRPIRMYHLDLYRLQDEGDLDRFGYDQFLDPGDGVSVIEWPERAGAWLPERYLLIDFTIAGPSRRVLGITGFGGFQLLGDLVANQVRQ